MDMSIREMAKEHLKRMAVADAERKKKSKKPEGSNKETHQMLARKLYEAMPEGDVRRGRGR